MARGYVENGINFPRISYVRFNFFKLFMEEIGSTIQQK
jgi:hypothetical protein